MRAKKVIKPSGQDVNQHKRELLTLAKRGDHTAKENLRNMGLLYWEHAGSVIVHRVCANSRERHGAIPWSFSYKHI